MIKRSLPLQVPGFTGCELIRGPTCETQRLVITGGYLSRTVYGYLSYLCLNIEVCLLKDVGVACSLESIRGQCRTSAFSSALRQMVHQSSMVRAEAAQFFGA